MRILYFVKIANQWCYWDPYFNGDVYQLQMVEGADTLLDKMSEGESNIVAVAIEPNTQTLPHYLEKVKEDDLGCTYKVVSPYYSGEIWICNVTLTLFGEFPKTIGFTKVDKRII